MQPALDGESPRRIVAVSGGVSDPSSTRLLADRIVVKLVDVLNGHELDAHASVVELAPLGVSIGAALTGRLPDHRLREAMDVVAEADVVVAAAPVYKAGISGLFKSFVDLMDNDLLVGKTVLLAATAGSARHAMVADDHLRPLFAFMRAVTVPTSVFAAPEDWADPALGRRIERAAVEAAALDRGRLESEVLSRSWDAYQHAFGSSRSRNRSGSTEVDFDTPLMRLAAGGQATTEDGAGDRARTPTREAR